MADTRFARLAALSQLLEGTSKRLDLTMPLTDLLCELVPEEVPPAVRLLMGQVFPEWDSRALDLVPHKGWLA